MPLRKTNTHMTHPNSKGSSPNEHFRCDSIGSHLRGSGMISRHWEVVLSVIPRGQKLYLAPLCVYAQFCSEPLDSQ